MPATTRCNTLLKTVPNKHPFSASYRAARPQRVRSTLACASWARSCAFPRGRSRSFELAAIFWAACVVLATSLSVADDPQLEPASPRETFEELEREFQARSRDFRAATTDLERKAAVELQGQFALRFVAFAEANAADPIALDAVVEAVRALNSVDSLTQLTWETNESAFPESDAGDAAQRAVAVVHDRHLQSDALGPVCLRMSYGLRGEYAGFLRAVAGRNPHRDVRAIAALSLAEFLESRRLKLEIVEGRGELAGRLERLLGAADYATLRGADPVRAAAEIEAAFEEAARYGETPHPYGGTIGEHAQAALYEIRHLSVGKEAPEIEGVDQHGVRFKLSDYRGKAVLLDFWQEYCLA